MIICEAPQSSSEWHQFRAGSITASMFSVVMDKLTRGPNKGDWKTAAHDYAFKLAIERIAGKSIADEQFDTWAMRRGRELEPEARACHAFQYGLQIEPAGFVQTDDGKFGASADGLIGDKGGAEYKCFVSPEKLRAIWLDDDIGDVIWQIQGGLWVTGREWWHFGLYCPALRPIGKELKVIEFERDEEKIGELEQELVRFDRLVEDYKAKLENAK